MSKLQTIFWLLLLLVIVFSMDQMFGNPIRETFKGIEKPVGSDLDYKYDPNKKMEPGYGFLAATQPSVFDKSDDQPLYFGFSSTFLSTF
jgi:hypothetical protein